jgi:KDO2-lipid IV(A) lauroyltransferase
MLAYSTYLLIRLICLPLSFLSFSALRGLGRFLGSSAFYLSPKYRKRCLSNLALAQDLSLAPAELKQVAKESLQSFFITCLEYPKLAATKDISRFVQCENPNVALKLHKEGKGIVFFCGHQANWEVLFLDGTSRMRGMAIGKWIKNKYLYRWIISIREKYGGTIIEPRSAMRKGLHALRQGAFLGIVGDQGMPDSHYAYPFFGRRAWTSTAPALLAYGADCPLIFAETRRVQEGYRIHYSDPIWPDKSVPAEKEVPRLMHQVLFQLQESIKKAPGEWLWQHNRWKQRTSCAIHKPFSYDCICVILPPDPTPLLPHLCLFRKIYATHFLILLSPHPLVCEHFDEVLVYSSVEKTLLFDYRFKLVFNLSGYHPIHRHYLSLSAFRVVDLCMKNFPQNLQQLVCRD